MKKSVIAIILVVISLCACLAACGSSSSSNRNYSSSSKKGFVGSDGKYHEYVPEFGQDVNDWMKENW